MPFPKILKPGLDTKTRVKNRKTKIHMYLKINAKKKKRHSNVTETKCCCAIIYYMVILWTAPSRPREEKKTEKTKHNKQRFKIDSVWLQVALSVYSKPEEIKSCVTSFCCSLSLTLSQFWVFSVYVYACVWWTKHRLSEWTSGGSEQTALEEKRATLIYPTVNAS